MGTPKGYELMQRAGDLVSALMAADGETSDIIEQAIAELDDDVAQKMDGYRYHLTALNQRIEWIKAEAKKMNAKANSLEKEVKKLKGRAQEVLESQTDLHGWEQGRITSSDLGKVYLSKRTRTKITDEKKLMAELEDKAPQLVVTKSTVNRSALTAALESGTDFEYATSEGFVTITFK